MKKPVPKFPRAVWPFLHPINKDAETRVLPHGHLALRDGYSGNVVRVFCRGFANGLVLIQCGVDPVSKMFLRLPTRARVASLLRGVDRGLTGQRMCRARDAAECGESFELLPDFVEQTQGDVQQLLDRTDEAIRQIQALATAEDRDATACAARARVSHKSVPQQTEVLSKRPGLRKQPVSSLPWLVLGVGLSVFVCGAILTAWALLGQRPELWSVGVPLLVAGQVAVFAVIIWQFESIWRSDQATFHILHGVDERLQSLRRAAGNGQHESSATELRLRHDASHSTADTVEHWLAVKNELDALRGDIQSAVDQDS